MAKYTLDLGREFEQQLNEIAKAKDLSKAEVIRRAVATYVVLNREAANGKKVVIQNEQGEPVTQLAHI